MSTSAIHWREILDLVQGYLLPVRFDREIQYLLDRGYGRDEAVCLLEGLVGHYLVEGAGLAAALGSSGRSAAENLGELAYCLEGLADSAAVSSARRQTGTLSRFRDSYRRYASRMGPLLSDLGAVIASVLGIYVSDRVYLEDDPNSLFARAQTLAHTNPGRARMLIASAGAMALVGKRAWWGWPDQISPQLRPWTLAVMGFVGSVTSDGKRPLRDASTARRAWPQESECLRQAVDAVRESRMTLAEIQFAHGAKSEDLADKELIYCLFDGREAVTAELLEAFSARDGELASQLMDLVMERRLWSSESVGGGWAPINAVRVLGWLRAGAAADCLARVAVETHEDDLLHDYALQALEQIGPASVAPLLHILRYSRSTPCKLAVAPVLGRAGRGRQEVIDALVGLYSSLEEGDDPGCALLGLAALKEPQVAQILRDALGDPRLLPWDVAEIEEALEESTVLV